MCEVKTNAEITLIDLVYEQGIINIENMVYGNLIYVIFEKSIKENTLTTEHRIELLEKFNVENLPFTIFRDEKEIIKYRTINIGVRADVQINTGIFNSERDLILQLAKIELFDAVSGNLFRDKSFIVGSNVLNPKWNVIPINNGVGEQHLNFRFYEEEDGVKRIHNWNKIRY